MIADDEARFDRIDTLVDSMADRGLFALKHLEAALLHMATHLPCGECQAFVVATLAEMAARDKATDQHLAEQK